MIEFKNVYKFFKNNLILNDVSFKIENNDFCIIYGDNGSGKTTTINLILGLLKLNKTDKGEIIDDFKEVSYFPEKFILPSLIKVSLFLNTYFNNHEKEIKELMERYQIPNKIISTLSKGMQQKIILIKTLLDESDLYIFDEPLNGLDKDSKILFKEDLKKLKDKGKTIIISSHDIDFFSELVTKEIRIGKKDE